MARSYYRELELAFRKDFRIIYGKADEVAKLPAAELEDHALVIFTPHIPQKLQDLRPVHQSLISTDVLFNRRHPTCFKDQDALADHIVAVLKNSQDKRGIIFCCAQGEIRSVECAYTAKQGCEQPYFQAVGGKLKAGGSKTSDLLFRVHGPLFATMAHATFDK